MSIRILLALLFASAPLFGQPPQSGDGNWPRQIDTDSIHLVIYQPQVESWNDNRIEARSAVIVTRAGDAAQIFGMVSIHARTDVDKETRLVSLEDVTIDDANFPSATSMQPMLLGAVRGSVPGWPRTVSLDRLLADLAITQATAKGKSIICAIDLSRESVNLIRYADDLARRFSAKLRLVHAVGVTPARHGFRSLVLQEAHDRILNLQKEAGTNLDVKVEEGVISTVVSNAARRFDGDLVVIRRGGLQHTLGRLRTNAYAIIRDSPCPVLSI